MSTKQEAYAKISELVTRFSEQIDSYKQSDYNETLTRRDFIDLHKELHTIKIPSKTEQLQTRIDYTDNRINQLVYELYGLTDEEIAMVEGEDN
jgi:predicted  nucleic acid-binding Zn-ribbon protein